LYLNINKTKLNDKSKMINNTRSVNDNQNNDDETIVIIEQFTVSTTKTSIS